MSMKFLILFLGVFFLIRVEGNAAPHKCYQPNKTTAVGKKTVDALVGADIGQPCYLLYPNECPDPRKYPTRQCSSSPASS